MAQVKEFLNYQESQDENINKWIQSQAENIEIVDIKYSVSCFQAEREPGWHAKEFSGVLIIYKIKD